MKKLISICNILLLSALIATGICVRKIIKRNNVYLENNNLHLQKTNLYLERINKKLSIKNDIVRNGNYLFYVPNYPYEMHQNFAVEEQEIFTELSSLKKMDELLPDNPVILDIGANIGNHTLYWLKESPRKAKYVYAFEVIDETFEILKKNIELNELQNRTTLFHFGLGANNTNASISSMSFTNMGATSIQEDINGKFVIKKLDNIKLNHKIDFVKIDVEGFELEVIKGAKEFLKKDKPMIWVELWDETGNGDPRYQVGNKEKYNQMMTELGYKMILQLDDRNFVYKHQSNQ